nr:hypothetical protein [uncultured Blautia sp.]
MNKTKERPTSQPITVNIDKLSAMLSCVMLLQERLENRQEQKL